MNEIEKNPTTMKLEIDSSTVGNDGKIHALGKLDFILLKNHCIS